MKYLALLRGINVGGKNTIAMNVLQKCFQDLEYTCVSTYINSGNVLFETNETPVLDLINNISKAIESSFGCSIAVAVITKTEYISLLESVPSWWGTKPRNEVRSDILFVIPPTSPTVVWEEFSKNTTSVDSLMLHGKAIFWSLPMADYGKSVVPKIIKKSIYQYITMRNSNTFYKLGDLLMQGK